MENKTQKKALPPFVILAIIALIAALALALTNELTRDPIRAYQQKQLAESFSAVLPAQNYEELAIPASHDKVGSLAKATDENGQVLGYCVKASAAGYGGPVAVILGVDPTGKVTGSVIGDSEFAETDGFGKRWLQEANVERLVGLDAVEGGAFEALSGATKTSNAVLNATNSALACVAEVGLDKNMNQPVVFGKPVAADASEGASPLKPGATLLGEAEGFEGGAVKVTVKLDEAAKIASLTVDASTQTVGIGQNCEGEDFTGRFVGKTIPLTLGTDVDALSGATVTSTAVVEAINTAVEDNPWKPGAALEGKAVGFGDGEITVRMTLDGEAKIQTLTVDASTQTPGIGQNCAKADFTDRFIGKAAPLTLGTDVDALSGATVTSTAVVEAVNSAYAIDAVEEEEVLTELAADETATLGLREDGTARLTATDAYNGTIYVAYQVENGKVVAAELNAKQEEEKPSAQDAAAPLSLTVPAYEGKEITVTVTTDGNGAIASLKVNADTQTVGLGARCADEAFTKQFIGKRAPLTLGKDIDAVSNATVTSTAVVDAVNQLLGGENAPAAEAADENAAAAPLSLTVPAYEGKEITVTVTTDGNGAIASLKVDAATQTAGLGKRCADEAFTKQFIGKRAPLTLGKDIDAVSNATVTSTAVVDAVNQLLGGENAPAADAAEENAAAAPLSLTVPAYESKEITVTVTTDRNGAIASLKVDAATQTAGLGKRCADEAFTKQFIGKSAPLTLGKDIDAVSNATITSTAVVDAVNELLNHE